jgi:high-affinity iron transporter
VRTWHRLVGILQYLEADYPAAVESQAQSELDEQQAFASEAITAARDLGPRAEAYLPRLVGIQQRINSSMDPEGVSRDCAELVEDLVLAGGLARSPRHTPDVERGRELFATQGCAVCHGAKGDGKVELAATMNPKPANFLDPEVMGGLTPYKAFNTLTFGVTGTAMPSFNGVLEEEDRWALAFFVLSLRHPPCDGRPVGASLEQLATSNDLQLTERFGADAVGCLRHKPPDVDEERALLIARAGIEDALSLSPLGKHDAARQAVLDSYLNGLEPVEPLLRARDPALVQALEASYMRTRLAAEHGSPHLADEGRELLTLIDRARRDQSTAPSFWSVFVNALLILLREGFEATVVIAALLAVLKKMDARQHAKVVHAGWVSALIVGAMAFVFGRTLLAGAPTEWVEGLMSLVAVAMLVYAALWLNARANIRKFMTDLRGKMTGALGRGSVAGLFTIAFFAMLRESFETAVFLQGLSVSSASGVAWGVAAGLALLLCMVLFVSRVGYVLPMKALFNASTVVLMATSVVLLGKGMHALQLVGVVPLQPLRFVQVDFLGVYPDVFSLLPQLLLALAPIGWLVLRRKTAAVPVPGP